MSRKFLICSFLLFFIQLGYTQQLWQLSFKDGQLTDQGYYESSETKFKKHSLADFNSWKTQLLDSSQGGRILIFFHSLWGSSPGFFKMNLAFFEEEFLTDSSPVEHVIFVKWRSPSLIYKKNVRQTLSYGSSTAPILNDLIQSLKTKYPNQEIILSAHSQGNRILMGWLDSCTYSFDRIVLLAPDLSNDEFVFRQAYLKNTNETYLFYKDQDRLLKYSARVLKVSRLGKNPNEESLGKFSHVRLENRNLITDEKKLGGKFIGHMYYMNSSSTVTLLHKIYGGPIQSK